VEADVRLYHGVLEVRHLKSVGPLPIFWDRWRLARPGAARLGLEELLVAVGPDTELMLDLKGFDRRLAARVLEAVTAARLPRTTVCARNWRLLAPFEGAGFRVVYSVRTRRQLARLLGSRRLPPGGVSIHESLLCAATVRELRARAEVVLTWPVTAAARARELAEWGVDGLITERLELAGELVSA
jgi:glycerophosphoryl diester phosphodiesterase